MAKVSVSRRNINKPAPRWFRKTKSALTILGDTAVIMLLAMGYAENSLVMLICRVGLSGALQALEAILSNGEVYAPAPQPQQAQ